MLDSFDNDGLRNNPTVSLMINDGTRSFDHQTDGSQQVLSSKYILNFEKFTTFKAVKKIFETSNIPFI